MKDILEVFFDADMNEQDLQRGVVSLRDGTELTGDLIVAADGEKVCFR